MAADVRKGGRAVRSRKGRRLSSLLNPAKVRARLVGPIRVGGLLLARAAGFSKFAQLQSYRPCPAHVAAWSIDPGLYAMPPVGESDTFELRKLSLAVPPKPIYPEYRYERPPPRLLGDSVFVAELANWYRTLKEASDDVGIATVEATLETAILFRDAVYIATAQGVMPLYESLRAADRKAAIFPTGVDLRTTRPLSLPAGADVVFLGCVGSFNYGHFLTDDLTRVSMPRADGSTVFLLTDHGALMNARREELLRLTLDGHSFQVRFIAGDQPVTVERLRYVSRATRHPILKSPDAITTMVDRVMRSLPLQSGARWGERLLVARTGTISRGLVNLPEITEMLAARGFRVLDPVKESAVEQITACSVARCIVGVMGAAMTNTLFARPGTAVIHLAPEDWMEPYYWDLAAVRDHRYTAVYGPSFGHDAPWLRSFRLAPELLEQAIDKYL